MNKVLPAINLAACRCYQKSAMTRVAIIIVIVLLVTSAFGQTKTYFGVEAAGTNDIYELTDEGNALKSVPLITAFGGVNVRQDLHKNLFLETGLLRKYYGEGIAFKNSFGYAESDAINAWLIPLRLGARINLHKEKIFLIPVIGYSFCINSDYRYGNGIGRGSNRTVNGQNITYNDTSYYDLEKTFPLLQTGMGFEFKFLRIVLFSLSANYFTGFKKIIIQDISYSVNNSPPQTATSVSKGQMLSVNAGVKYPISDFWAR